MHDVLAFVELGDIELLQSSNSLHFILECGFVIVHGEREVLYTLMVIVVFLHIESRRLIFKLVGSVLDGHALLLLRGARHLAHTTELVLLVRTLHSLHPGSVLSFNATPRTMIGIYFVHQVFTNCFLLHYFDSANYYNYNLIKNLLLSLCNY